MRTENSPVTHRVTQQLGVSFHSVQTSTLESISFEYALGAATVAAVLYKSHNLKPLHRGIVVSNSSLVEP